MRILACMPGGPLGRTLHHGEPAVPLHTSLGTSTKTTTRPRTGDETPGKAHNVVQVTISFPVRSSLRPRPSNFPSPEGEVGRDKPRDQQGVLGPHACFAPARGMPAVAKHITRRGDGSSSSHRAGPVPGNVPCQTLTMLQSADGGVPSGLVLYRARRWDNHTAPT